MQELKINQAAQCPHVVVCYHSFYHNGAISLVLEYMDRGSLADVVRQVKTILEPYLAVVCKQVSGFWNLKLNERTKFFLYSCSLTAIMFFQVLQGLVYLHHERHVIHRDIKPSNLLVNHKGEVKITDFGVSAMLASSMGQRDTFVGTYNYMSVCEILPETKILNRLILFSDTILSVICLCTMFVFDMKRDPTGFYFHFSPSELAGERMTTAAISGV